MTAALRHAALALLLASTWSCTAVITDMTDPEVEVTQLELRADKLGALRAAACVTVHGDKGCSPYPNPLECESMAIRVRGDGSTCADCRRGRKVETVCGGVADGIPIICHASAGLDSPWSPRCQ